MSHIIAFATFSTLNLLSLVVGNNILNTTGFEDGKYFVFGMVRFAGTTTGYSYGLRIYRNGVFLVDNGMNTASASTSVTIGTIVDFVAGDTINVSTYGTGYSLQSSGVSMFRVG